MNSFLGYLKGETCNRGGCQGTIIHEPEGSCYCFSNPPCSYCTDDSQYCDRCGWEATDERISSKTTHTPRLADVVIKKDNKREGYYDVVRYWDTYPEYKAAKKVTYEEAERLQNWLHSQRSLGYLTTYEIRSHAE